MTLRAEILGINYHDETELKRAWLQYPRVPGSIMPKQTLPRYSIPQC